MKTAEELFEVKEGRPGTGMGLYAREPIKKKDFILEYVGKRIPSKVADTMKSRYLFELNPKWTLDGPPEINLAGYINHACEPNVEAEVEQDAIGEDRINIYAVRDIAAGEELTIDYGEEYFDEFIRPHGCKCGASKHRG